MLSAVGLTPAAARGMAFYRTAGCKECYRTGFKGRIGIFEILPVDDAIKSLILSGASHGEIVQGARDRGMLSMMECGIRKVRAGITTLEELLRVTSL
jgi:type II secretory ATPase GspE/PulE/Tfp pilus assembly ATPase PilB-like protein